jgi:excisionase family DNA binding protein
MLTQMMNVDQVAEWLRLSKSSVYRLTAQGEIPHVKVGGSLRFDQHEVARKLLDDERDAAGEPRPPAS